MEEETILNTSKIMLFFLLPDLDTVHIDRYLVGQKEADIPSL